MGLFFTKLLRLGCSICLVQHIYGDILSYNETWSSGDIQCNQTDDTCTINCDAISSCGQNAVGVGNGPVMYCPNNNHCSQCTLYCNNEWSCSGATIHGYSCNALNIHATAKDNKQMTIHAPNNGSLYINVTQILSGGKLKESFIHSGSNTKDMVITCDNREFATNMVNATDITGTLSIVSTDACDFKTNDIYCPSDSGDIGECNIECTGNKCENNEFFAANGNYDLQFSCNATSCIGNMVYCSDGNTTCSADCDHGVCYSSLSSSASPLTNQTTVTPTNSPSASPSTVAPTVQPSVSVSDAPSFEPSGSPTRAPADSDDEFLFGFTVFQSAAIAFGVFLFLCCLVCVLCFYCWRRAKKMKFARTREAFSDEINEPADEAGMYGGALFVDASQKGKGRGVSRSQVDI